MSSVTVVIINSLLFFVMRRISLSEKHATITDLNVSVAFKLTVARFLNSSVVLVLVNSKPHRWFKRGDLVVDATLLMLIMAFSPPVKNIIWIP